MQGVIMAGGKGTRLQSVTKDEIPKPMVIFSGKPLIEHAIINMIENGIKEIFIIIGHLGSKIIKYCGDGEKWNISIEYIIEDKPLGTAGALYYLKNKCQSDFLLVYADVFFQIDVKRMYQFHKKKNSEVTLLVHPNSHPYDSDLIIKDSMDKVINLVTKNNRIKRSYDNCVNAGIFLFSRKFLNHFKKAAKSDLEKDILKQMVEKHEDVYAYHSTEFVMDVGTPERLKIGEQINNIGIPQKKCLKHKQKCIFLDRDGTLNIFRGLISKPEQIQLIPGVADAIQYINQSEYMVIVITNQPVIARGLCSIQELDEIHNYLKTLLGDQGAYLDDIKYCPHHPDKGYPEENPYYKVECDCRKPKPGLILKASMEYNIDLNQSWMVGDTYRDVFCGKNAGVKNALIENEYSEPISDLVNKDIIKNTDFLFHNLNEAIEYIIR